MHPLKVVIAPDPILNLKSVKVNPSDMTDQMRKFISDMKEMIYLEPAVGYAAIQFGVPKQIIVMDLGSDDDEERPKDFYPLVLINPEITYSSEEMIVATEGCMSIPEIKVDVPRPKEIEIKFMDMDFKEKKIKTGGWLARVIQHEMDHLHGKTLLDYLSTLKRDVSIRKLQKFKKKAL
ncbi:MAG: peptide deformylase [Pseudomonadota bacterium]|jgi:peptide deformylase